MGVPVDQLPRMYLASAKEVAQWLRVVRNGLGNSVMNEDYTYTKGLCRGVTDKVPAAWVFSEQRIKAMFADENTG